MLILELRRNVSWKHVLTNYRWQNSPTAFISSCCHQHSDEESKPGSVCAKELPLQKISHGTYKNTSEAAVLQLRLLCYYICKNFSFDHTDNILQEIRSMQFLCPEKCFSVSSNSICLNSYTPDWLLLQCGSSDDLTLFVLLQPKVSDWSVEKVTSSLKSNLGGWYLQSIYQRCSLLSVELQSGKHFYSQCCTLLCHPAAFQGGSQHICHQSLHYHRCLELSSHTEHCFDILATCFFYIVKWR